MRWLLVAMFALAACTSSGTKSTPTSTTPVRTVTVVCSTTTNLTATQLEQAKRVLLARGQQATGGRAKIDSTSSTSVAVALPGFDSTFTASFCRTGSLQFRPVIAPPQRLTCGGRCDPDPLRGTSVPSTEAAFAALPTAQRQRLLRSISTFACLGASQNTSAPTQLACPDDATVYLLGPVILTNDAIRVAQPSADAVQLSLTATATRTWSAWTTAHHANGPTGAESCAPTATPCSDFVAFVLDGKILSAPLVVAPITGGEVQISGNFTSTRARELADQLAVGALPAVFSGTAVRNR